MAGARTEVRTQIDRKYARSIVALLLIVMPFLVALTSQKAMLFFFYVVCTAILSTALMLGFFILAEKYGERVLYWLGLISSRSTKS